MAVSHQNERSQLGTAAPTLTMDRHGRSFRRQNDGDSGRHSLESGNPDISRTDWTPVWRKSLVNSRLNDRRSLAPPQVTFSSPSFEGCSALPNWSRLFAISFFPIFNAMVCQEFNLVEHRGKLASAGATTRVPIAFHQGLPSFCPSVFRLTVPAPVGRRKSMTSSQKESFVGFAVPVAFSVLQDLCEAPVWFVACCRLLSQLRITQQTTGSVSDTAMRLFCPSQPNATLSRKPASFAQRVAGICTDPCFALVDASQ